MPYYDHLGVHYYKDDACLKCAIVDICNVYSDLSLDEKESKYDEKHIVQVGEGKKREGYMECQSYTEYVNPNEKVDPNPKFGLAISEQESAARDGI